MIIKSKLGMAVSCDVRPKLGMHDVQASLPSWG